jgi:hypothetical protein
MQNRHERRRTKVFARTMADAPKIRGSMCAWEGCTARFSDDMPAGWTYLFTYWSKKPRFNFFDIPASDVLRDGVLCPEHVRVLESQLKEIGRDLERAPPLGNA